MARKTDKAPTSPGNGSPTDKNPTPTTPSDAARRSSNTGGGAATYTGATHQLTVQDAQLAAKWDSFLQDYAKAQIQQAALDFPEVRSVAIPFNDIQLRDPDLANYLLHKPSQALRIGSSVMHQVDVTVEPRPRLHLRIVGLPDSQRIKPGEVRVEHLGQLLRVEATVRKLSPTMAAVIEGVYECKVCTSRAHLIQEEEFLVEPVLCETCDAQRPWRFVVEESRFMDHQRVVIADLGDVQGGNASEIHVHVHEDNAGRLNLGDTVTVNGILTPVRKRREGKDLAISGYVLQAISLEIQQRQAEQEPPTADEERQIMEIAARPDALEYLVTNFAPHIHDMELAKLSLLVGLVGGVTYEADATHKQRLRGDIHVNLVGDPATGKSQLLGYAALMTKRYVRTTGKGTSGAGLTAAAVNEANAMGTTEWCLRAGALALADLAVCIIDELNLLDEKDLGYLNDGLEDQRIHMNKAGISAAFWTRCPVLAAANPKKGRFRRVRNGDGEDPYIVQSGLPPALISRFDLFVCLLDTRVRDREKARFLHMCQARSGQGVATADGSDAMGEDLLRKYIALAKSRRPKRTAEVEEYLATVYTDLRMGTNAVGGEDLEQGVTIRQGEAFIRVTEAIAKLHQRDEITLADAKVAVDLLKESYRSSGVIDSKGNFNARLFDTPAKITQHDRMHMVLQAVKDEAARDEARYAREESIINLLRDQGLDREAVLKALELHKRNNALFQPGGRQTWAPIE